MSEVKGVIMVVGELTSIAMIVSGSFLVDNISPLIFSDDKKKECWVINFPDFFPDSI